ncbi:MAG: PPC domain-containing protein [bacterium]
MRGSLGVIIRLGLILGLVSVFAAGCKEKDTCGNGTVEEGESCDGSDLGGSSCLTLGYASGALACSDQCVFDLSGCELLVDCGNDVVDSGEQCDGSDLNGQTCESRALGGGTLGCDPVTCQFDISGCEGGGICGDGVADGDEQCDGIDFRGLSCETLDGSYLGGQLDCSPSCVLRTSGCYTLPDFPIGQPCETNDDCPPDGRCIPEYGGGYFVGAPGGVCVERCGDGGTCPLSGEAGVCVGSGYMSFCFLRCDPAAPVCRDGYECFAQGDVGFCYPNCTDDSQCVVTGNCDMAAGSDTEGWCVPLPEVCTGGIDEDVDGLVDCADPDCNGTTACPTGEDCTNGTDDDGDGAADCDDGECVWLGVCTGNLCEPVAGAVLTCGTSLTGESNDASGFTTTFNRYECGDPSGGPMESLGQTTGPEYAYTLTVPSAQLVTVTVSGLSSNLNVAVVKQYAGQYCDPGISCFAFGENGGTADEVITFAAYPTMTYYVIVDGRQGAVSTYDIDVTCDATGAEDCGNNTDDGDSLIDCNDPECMGVPPHCG